MDYLSEQALTHTHGTRSKAEQQQSVEMATCNNCSLKEKEQVYTAARDGNLMYLKVSVGPVALS